MDNPSASTSSQQPQSLPAQSGASGQARNIKNLSIKEFFTTRLMRTRSFETSGINGGQNSPKDEPTNWFEEFKSRMTKKSQNNNQSNKHQQNSNSGPTVKDNCDNINLANLSEDCEYELDDIQSQPQTTNNLQPTLKENSSTSKSNTTSGSGLRKRNIQMISTVKCPDFETASINTIFNLTDDRQDRKSLRKSIYDKLLKVLNLFGWIISYLIPFNYNLPWKLLSLLNFSFVIIVIALTRQAKPEVKAFTFFNGFISGLLIATMIFIILITSLLVKIFPKTDRNNTSKSLQRTPNELFELHSLVSDTQDLFKESNTRTVLDTPISSKDDSNSQKIEEYSTFEVLDSKSFNDVIDSTENQLVDHDYKGWMIEFVGDYELRSKSELFKLKLIYVKIENKVLYLCKPKNSHDVESTAFPVFSQQRIYNLGTATRFSANLLLPKNVRNTQKWVWSKKYPIKLEFQDDNAIIQPPPKTLDVHTNKTVQLTLFAKCGREKEEWFRRFKKIVEDNRLVQGGNKKFSFQSDISAPSEDGIGLFGSIKNFRCRSPSPTSKSCNIQSSKSSHMLHESRKFNADIDKTNKIIDNNNVPSLTRTKSCELINEQQNSNPEMSDKNFSDFSQRDIEECAIADDSTLTRETAEVFGQAVEYSNFLDNQPTLDYREYIERVISASQEATSSSDWFNSLTGRILFDVFSREYWSIWFKRKIQRKLHRIRLPYFMETLTLTTIDLGTSAPQFLNVVSHSFDSFGLSIDFDMTYSGGLSMTFETKLNLLKFKNDNASTSSTANTTVGTQEINSTPTSLTTNNPSSNTTGNNNNSNTNTNQQANNNLTSSQATTENLYKENSNQENKSANEIAEGKERNTIQLVTEKTLNQSSSGSARTSEESSNSSDSDSSSSSDSLCDEADVDEISDWEDYGAEKTRQNIVKFVDKIASSRYFQHATENRYIKKKLIDISNCPLVLIVQIQSLSGILTVNVPPPQTDRIWYGFKPNPELTLKALPKMGDRELNLSHVTDWIEKKLAEEFKKVLVIPNMEDIVLPVLKSDHLSYITTTR